jgi:putative membrane-bound dehydrogenase-like protein
MSATPLAAQVPPEKAEATFTVTNPELEWKLWASEPLFSNPTSMDIDHKGRVWVCEAVNYRQILRGKPVLRPEGDRILILEDSTGSGKADKVTVFAQAPYVQAPLGIAVAKDPVGPGWKVYVCQSPDILLFEDKDGDGKADGSPKKLLTGFRGVDHDHGVHGILIGPDGKLYFSVGDQGVENLQSADGKGRKWTTNHTDCQAGTIWRCNLDGTNLELIAHNFRNEYEPCVDSFGTIFVSDNDDDGNQQTRICYVMPGGNYGYWPRGKGESHWHEEQPGVVPKILRTYFGSPTGMCVYEGTLLPKKYWGQVLHTDAGPRHVRCYHMKPQGAGYEVEREDIVTSTDNWFRPSDICVAPDGSVFVADWYDPGVGGHGMGDTTRGRIYRLAPKGHQNKVPKVDLKSKDGLLAALGSPNLAVRYMAVAKLGQMPRVECNEALMAAIYQKEKPWLRARALWQMGLLAKKYEPRAAGEECEAVKAFSREDSQLKLLGVRLIKSTLGKTWADTIGDGQFSGLIHDGDIATRRELLLAMQDEETSKAKEHILTFAKSYDGKDRFYLAALGIAVGTDPKRREVILADFDKHFPEWNDKVADLVWELRPPSVLPRLERLLADGKLPARQRARIVDILATGPDANSGALLLRTLVTEPTPEIREHILANLKLFLQTKWRDLNRSPELAATIDKLLSQPDSAPLGLALIAAAERVEAIPRLRKLLEAHPSPAIKQEAVRTLGALPSREAAVVLRDLRKQADATTFGPAIVQALGQQLDARKNNPGHPPALEELQRLVQNKDTPGPLREAALAALVGSRTGTQWLLDLQTKKTLPAELVADAGRYVRNTPYQDLRNRALIAFPPPGKLDIAKLPPLTVLATRRGDAGRGKQVLAASIKGDAQCLKCHTVQGVGGQIGPDLSKIGTKASRENLYESILFPSKAIADQFVTWQITTIRGTVLSGLIVEEKPDAIILRDANGKDTRIDRKEIESREKSPHSLMPEDNAKTLTEEELVDLVEYLATLR